MEALTKTKGLVIELDSTLNPHLIQNDRSKDFNKRITDTKQKTVRDCIEGEYRHINYIEYLQIAWANHYGIIMSPDIFWFILLNECAGYIKENSEHYRSLFTTATEGKTEIIVPTADPELIDLNLIADQLRKLVPSDIDIFMPEFSTSTMQSSFAFKAAFADAMSPYYNYSMFLCGIPKVRIEGTIDDWNKVCGNIEKLKSLLNKNKNISWYFDGVKNLAEIFISILNKSNYSADRAFWQDIFSLEKCGSGSQVDVKGWITEMFIKLPRPAYVNNFPTNIAKVPYKFLNTGQNFELKYGLFGSNIEDGFLVPDFGFIINELQS